jgi:hypothetical protein
MIKMHNPVAGTDYKAKFVAKNKIEDNVSFNQFGVKTVPTSETGEFFNIIADYTKSEGDIQIYYQIDDYTGDYTIDHFYFGAKASFDDCRKTAFEINGELPVTEPTKVKNNIFSYLFSGLFSRFRFEMRNI